MLLYLILLRGDATLWPICLNLSSISSCHWGLGIYIEDVILTTFITAWRSILCSNCVVIVPSGANLTLKKIFFWVHHLRFASCTHRPCLLFGPFVLGALSLNLMAIEHHIWAVPTVATLNSLLLLNLQLLFVMGLLEIVNAWCCCIILHMRRVSTLVYLVRWLHPLDRRGIVTVSYYRLSLLKLMIWLLLL